MGELECPVTKQYPTDPVEDPQRTHFVDEVEATLQLKPTAEHLRNNNERTNVYDYDTQVTWTWNAKDEILCQGLDGVCDKDAVTNEQQLFAYNAGDAQQQPVVWAPNQFI